MMGRFIALRLVQTAIAVLGSTVIVFLLARVAGSPVDLLLSPTSTPQEVHDLESSLGLDQPLPVQYWRFLSGVFTGNLGTSIQFHEPALQLVAQRAPATLVLAGAAFAVVALVSIPAGVYAASRRGGRLDRVLGLFAAVGQAMPSFWLGTLFIFLFAVKLRWLPTSGSGSVAHLILPVLTLAIFAFPGLMRITRSSMLETLRTEYVKFARVKGAGESRVLWQHSFRNASLSVLTFATLLLLNMLSGSIIVENLFGWPGLGQLVIQAVQGRDFPVVQTTVLLLTIAYCVGNLFADVAYAFVNPRIRYSA